MGYRRDHMEVVSPFGKDGLIEDWDVVEQLWDHTLHKVRLLPAPSPPSSPPSAAPPLARSLTVGARQFTRRAACPS
jgi:actin-related protein